MLLLILLILFGVESESGRHGAGLPLLFFFFFVTFALNIFDGVRGFPVSLLLKVLIQSVDYVGVDVVDGECVPSCVPASLPLGVATRIELTPFRLKETQYETRSGSKEG